MGALGYLGLGLALPPPGHLYPLMETPQRQRGQGWRHLGDLPVPGLPTLNREMWHIKDSVLNLKLIVLMMMKMMMQEASPIKLPLLRGIGFEAKSELCQFPVVRPRPCYLTPLGFTCPVGAKSPSLSWLGACVSSYVRCMSHAQSGDSKLCWL